MRPKKKLIINVIDFSKYTDDQLLDMSKEFNESIDRLQSHFSPKATKKYAGLFMNLYLWTVETEKRFPEIIEQLEEELLLKSVLDKLKIKTNE